MGWLHTPIPTDLRATETKPPGVEIAVCLKTFPVTTTVAGQCNLHARHERTQCAHQCIRYLSEWR